jgi:hypothetical protein
MYRQVFNAGPTFQLSKPLHSYHKYRHNISNDSVHLRCRGVQRNVREATSMHPLAVDSTSAAVYTKFNPAIVIGNRVANSHPGNLKRGHATIIEQGILAVWLPLGRMAVNVKEWKRGWNGASGYKWWRRHEHVVRLAHQNVIFRNVDTRQPLTEGPWAMHGPVTSIYANGQVIDHQCRHQMHDVVCLARVQNARVAPHSTVGMQCFHL